MGEGGGGGENKHGTRYFLHRWHETLSAATIIHCDIGGIGDIDL